MNRIRQFFAWIFFKIVPPFTIMKAYEEDLIRNYQRQVTLGRNSRISKWGAVHNIPGDPARIRIGSDCVIDGELQIFNYGGEIELGDHVYLGKGSRVWSGEKILIGNDVLISHNVNLSDTSAHETDYQERAFRYKELLTSGHPTVKSTIKTAPIIIENHVWINFNAIILRGVRVGQGAIVAAGSVVVKDVEPFTMVAGNPARKIKDLK